MNKKILPLAGLLLMAGCSASSNVADIDGLSNKQHLVSTQASTLEEGARKNYKTASKYCYSHHLKSQPIIRKNEVTIMNGKVDTFFKCNVDDISPLYRSPNAQAW